MPPSSEGPASAGRAGEGRAGEGRAGEGRAGEGLVLTGVGVRFGGLVALDNVDLRVPPGRVVGVTGPNGAGKTTLFNVICGFVRPGRGTLTLDGAPFRPRPDKLAGLGIARTLQSLGLFASLTVRENVLVAARPTPAAQPPASALTELTLEWLGLAEHATARPDALPYAVRKRVALARALVNRPRLLLLDEPAAGLDADQTSWLADLLRSLPMSGPPMNGPPMSILLVEHNLDLVAAVCDEVLALAPPPA